MRKNEVYCVRLKEKKFYSHRGLTKILCLSIMDYEEKLKNDFNAIRHPEQKGNPCVYFKNIEDAQRAKTYLEGLYVMNKLIS